MKVQHLISAVLASVSICASAHALTLEFKNDSSWEIHELYFSSADEEDWGPDQLEEEVIEHGTTFSLNMIEQGVYDVKIVDEDGDSCEVNDVDFEDSEHFALTDEVLIGCQVATAAVNEEDDEA